MTDYSTILLRLREIFDKVVQMNNILFSKEEEKDIRTITLRKDAPKELGTEKYLENMATILNYQFATEAPIKVICNGMFNLINNCKNQDSYVTTLRQSAVSFLSYIAQYDVKKEYRVQESIKENDTDTREEIFAELENLPISNKNITEEQKGHYGSFRFTLSSCFCIKEEKGIPSKGEKLRINGNFCSIVKDLVDLIGQEHFFELYSIAPHIGYKFCIVWTATYTFNFNFSDEILNQIIFSPHQFTFENHPLINESPVFVTKYIVECKKRYKGKDSKLYAELLFDSEEIKIYIKRGNSAKIIGLIAKFKKNYSYIDKKLNGKIPRILGLSQGEESFFINQWIYFSLIEVRENIKLYLMNMSVENFSQLFYYLKETTTKWKRYNNPQYFMDNDYLKRRWNAIELSRMFLYQKIGREQFDRLHTIYQDTIGDALLRNLYNLVLGKFSFAFLKIGISYFTEGYHILLKQTFKNIRLQSPNDGLEAFDLPKERSNDLGRLRIDNEELMELINSNENVCLEFKSSVLFDRKEFLRTSKKQVMQDKKTKKYIFTPPYIKPLVSMLNTNGGKIVIGIWEKHKIEEEIEKKTFNKESLKKMVDISGQSYLTGINEDLELGCKTIDNLTQIIEQAIKEFIYPNPHSVGKIIDISFEEVCGRLICILDIPKGDESFYLKQDEQHKLYIRNNASDRELKDPKEIADFILSRNKN